MYHTMCHNTCTMLQKLTKQLVMYYYAVDVYNYYLYNTYYILTHATTHNVFIYNVGMLSLQTCSNTHVCMHTHKI